MTVRDLAERRMNWQRLLPRRGAISLPVALLAGVIVLAAVLAYQAQDAARSNQRRAEATLRDYSAFAASEYARQVRVQTFSVLRTSLEGVQWALNAPTGWYDPSPAWLAGFVARRRANMVGPYMCRCLDSVRYTFRVGIADSSITVAPADSTRAAERAAWPSELVQRWVRDTIIAHMARIEQPGPMRLQTSGADVDSPRFNFLISNDSYVLLVGEPDGVPRLLAYLVARDKDGRPLAAYGYDADPSTWLTPLLQQAIAEERLLPPSLMHGLKNEAVLAVTVSDQDGHEFFRSSPRYDARYAATDTLTGNFGDLRVQLAIFPSMAPQLLVGGLPRSRLPLLLALFSLTAALSLVALLQMRRQQELASLRTDFVSGVSHELRTPLAQIRWFAELLRMGKLRTPEERDRSLRIIDQESRRLHFLVENVLNFSRSGSPAGRVKVEDIPIADEVLEVVDSFLPLAQARHARVITALEGGARGMVDRGALRQILLNLLDNAVKYGPVGQTIQVGVEYAGTSRVRVWVQDEGPGIPEEERERIWEAFYRARRDLGSAVTGSGIGLNVVSELVQLQHGRRWVESGPAGGARFVLEFPAPPRPRPTPATRPRAAQRPSPTQAFEAHLATPPGTPAFTSLTTPVATPTVAPATPAMPVTPAAAGGSGMGEPTPRG